MTSYVETTLHWLNNPHPIDWISSYYYVSGNFIMTCFVIYVHYIAYKYRYEVFTILYNSIQKTYQKIKSLINKLESLDQPAAVPSPVIEPIVPISPQVQEQHYGPKPINDIMGGNSDPKNFFADMSGLEILFYEKLAQRNSLNEEIYGPDGFVYDNKEYNDFMFGPNNHNIPFMASDVEIPIYDIRRNKFNESNTSTFNNDASIGMKLYGMNNSNVPHVPKINNMNSFFKSDDQYQIQKEKERIDMERKVMERLVEYENNLKEHKEAHALQSMYSKPSSINFSLDSGCSMQNMINLPEVNPMLDNNQSPSITVPEVINEQISDSETSNESFMKVEN